MTAILFWVAVWAIAAFAIDNSVLFAGPNQVFAALVDRVSSMEFWQAIACSVVRVLGVSFASAVIGALLGLVAVHCRVLRYLCSPVVQVAKSAPVACIAVILLVILGSNGAVAVIIAFVVIPPFYVAAIESQNCRPKDTERILALAGLSQVRIFLAVSWQTALPFFLTAARSAMALSWRAGVTAELLGLPLHSIGEGIYISKLTFDVPGLFAWTIVVMLLGWMWEHVVSWVLRRTTVFARFAVRRVTNVLTELSSLSFSADQILVQGVQKTFGDYRVLDNLTLTVNFHERVCLMAPTGSGKTTLLRILLGLDRAEAGFVKRPQLCGVVLQNTTLVETLNAIENVLLVYKQNVIDEREIQLALKSLLPEGCLDKPVNQLSGGTRRLVEVARAVFSAGECLVMDEPFQGMDNKTKEKACLFILDNLKHRPLIIATHDSHDAQLLKARIEKLP